MFAACLTFTLQHCTVHTLSWGPVNIDISVVCVSTFFISFVEWKIGWSFVRNELEQSGKQTHTEPKSLLGQRSGHKIKTNNKHGKKFKNKTQTPKKVSNQKPDREREKERKMWRRSAVVHCVYVQSLIGAMLWHALPFYKFRLLLPQSIRLITLCLAISHAEPGSTVQY